MDRIFTPDLFTTILITEKNKDKTKPALKIHKA